MLKKKVQLIQGECLEEMAKLPDKSIDMILCDLPYGTTDVSWDTIIPFPELWEQYERIITNTGAIVLTAANPFSAKLICSNLPLFRYEIIWDKVNRATGYANARKQPMRIHENILVFYKRSPIYNPQMGTGKPFKSKPSKSPVAEVYAKGGLTGVSQENHGTRFPNSILRVKASDGKKSQHPTQKPVALCEWLIKTYTVEGQTVLDNCMGSGTTGVAAVNTGRNFIGMEMTSKFYRIARDRISEAQTGIVSTKSSTLFNLFGKR